MPDPPRNQSTRDIATLYQVTVRAVRAWTKDGCPSTNLGGKRGLRFSLDEVARWLKETGRRITHGGGKSAVPEDIKAQIDQANLRKAVALAVKYEMDAEERRGTLVSREDAERVQAEVAAHCRARLLGGPSSLSPDLVGLLTCPACQHQLNLAEVEAPLREWVIGALTELSSGGDE